MKLSIITVNLNNREGLQKTIDSVICQTFRDFEWIVIDGGSTDGSKELIEQYAGHFAYWVSEPDKGVYNAMNKGIRVAKGEYLQFLNSGDWLCNKDSIKSVWGKPQPPTADIIYGTRVPGFSWTIPHLLTLDFFLDSTLFHQSTFIRKQLFSEHLYDEKYKIVSDRKFFIEHIVLFNASYHAVDIELCNFQEGGLCSDGEKTEAELKQVLTELFPPMELELFHRFMKKKYAYMTPYYNYIDQHPKLSKWIRRIIRLHKKIVCS